MHADITDDDLVLRCLEQGDEEAFAELVRRYREPVFRVAVSVLGPQFLAEAEEVAQEVFLRVHASLGAFRGQAKFSSWIYRIAFNQALNLKSRVRYHVPHIRYQSLSETALADADGQELLLSEVLSDCVLRLPEVYQSAVRLYYWMEYSVPEIAAFLGVPENTAKSYLFRARQLLRAYLEKEGYPDA